MFIRLTFPLLVSSVGEPLWRLVFGTQDGDRGTIAIIYRFYGGFMAVS